MKRHTRKKNNRQTTQAWLVLPPPINPQVNIVHRFRFVARANAVSTNFSFNWLLDCMLVSISATALYKLFDEVKLIKVEVWTAGGNAATTGLNSNTVTILFPSVTAGEAGDAYMVSGTSIGLDPCHVKARPDPQSACALWQPPSANIAFSLEGLQGSTLGRIAEGTIIDVTLALRTNGNTPVASAAGVGLTPGQIYFRGLDGQPIATTLFYPIVNDGEMA